jgi:hypothetical protein
MATFRSPKIVVYDDNKASEMNPRGLMSNIVTVGWISCAVAFWFPILHIFGIVNLDAGGQFLASVTLVGGGLCLIAGFVLLVKGRWLGLLFSIVGVLSLFFSIVRAS